MYHLGVVTSHQIALLTRRSMCSPRLGTPVSLTCRSKRIASCCLGTVLVAVLLAVVAVRAQEEHLTASPAGHQP
jgi:small-conductance mechanosensitive channel